MQRLGQGHFHRSATNRMFLGVVGGLAESFGIDATILRLVVLLLLIPFNVLIVLLYLALALLLPREAIQGPTA